MKSISIVFIQDIVSLWFSVPRYNTVVQYKLKDIVSYLSSLDNLPAHCNCFLKSLNKGTQLIQRQCNNWFRIVTALLKQLTLFSVFRHQTTANNARNETWLVRTAGGAILLLPVEYVNPSLSKARWLSFSSLWAVASNPRHVVLIFLSWATVHKK